MMERNQVKIREASGMNKGADNRHEEFVERVGEALNSRAEALDGATRSRLNRARQSARRNLK